MEGDTWSSDPKTSTRGRTDIMELQSGPLAGVRSQRWACAAELSFAVYLAPMLVLGFRVSGIGFRV